MHAARPSHPTLHHVPCACCQAVLKILALSFGEYILKAWNIFDFSVIVLSLVQVRSGTSPHARCVTRCDRLGFSTIVLSLAQELVTLIGSRPPHR